MMPLRKTLSFGFEPTFTIPTWWTDPGFVATSDTPLKLEKMKLLAQNLAKVLKGRWLESQDIYQHIQFETFDSNHQASFVVTMDPGSIEVKTPPALAEHLTPLMAPLFEAATESGLVAYRNWWYGVQGGTEGGCHVNMGGFTPESNPLRNDPALLLKYAAFYHNNPWIHFPFMGVDVGPGGNAMRMDEHSLDPHAHHAPGSLDSLERFAFLAEKINRGEQPSADEVAKHLKGTKLAEDKHSAPSFYKFKGPLYLVEDRAVESLRSAEEVELVAELRLRILEFLQKTVQIQPLVHFGEKLHRELLSSAPLWEGFILMCRQIQLDPKPFRRFFDRQFPRLTQGEGSPTLLEFREGRRPRKITEIKMRGALIISKTIDPSIARLELHWANADLNCVVNGTLLEASGRFLVLDYRKTELPLDVALVNIAEKETVERTRFQPRDMMFKSPDFEINWKNLKSFGAERGPYYNLENIPQFHQSDP